MGRETVTTDRQRIGNRGEELAKQRLKGLGYLVLEANYRAKSGEIDLVSEKDGVLVFVEVRTRTSRTLGTPEESITPAKQSHLVGAAQEYLEEHEAAARDWRIDLVAVEFGPGGKLMRVDVVENAVEL